MSTMTLSPAVYVARPRSAARAEVRLTRRGRLVVFLLALTLALGAALWLAAGSMATSDSGPAADQPTEMIRVSSGQTLWTIAAERAEPGEIRAMMHEIRELNALSDSMLLAGQELFVPVD
ncbi:LysM peptidoglycan-binding domain-containing protein [Nocardioides donggukensis]|uniref:LysM peptidoglycan-binding domain-containing protein n=1 Tax=Nocardioides donggukensis TaxID=2774019 RepID=A0A927K4Z4_9ACTN|nr:LysM peptidoglycan-binding domain-containing protein [Nocardioides donggukensis]MBD8870624.1 LysM peptidoglycan-binding domain-containing protein [Nocardioides donggukensis]